MKNTLKKKSAAGGIYIRKKVPVQSAGQDIIKRRKGWRKAKRKI